MNPIPFLTKAVMVTSLTYKVLFTTLLIGQLVVTAAKKKK